MLRSLSIHNIVLIEALEIDFQPGLNVLTGETGAGKSILLDALGFVLGRRVRRDLVRADAEQGIVTAAFDIAPSHPVRAVLGELGFEDIGDEVILRRTARKTGPSRAFVNDSRISSEGLARIGASLVEVHGQHDDRGLLNPRLHRQMLDNFAGLEDTVAALRGAWAKAESARDAFERARETLAQAAKDADYLRHALAELDQLAPQAGEDEALDAERRLIQQSERLVADIERAHALIGAQGAEGQIADAITWLSPIAAQLDGLINVPIAALDRALQEIAQAQCGIADALEELRFDQGRIEIIEERLFALRGLARKHRVTPDALAQLTQTLREKLDAIDSGDAHLAELKEAARKAQADYETQAQALGEARRKSAQRLDKMITDELGPLKMENARFITAIEPTEPGPEGMDRVNFTARINPGAPAGPIDRIASGGELSRFLLAIKVCLAAQGQFTTMIFDEIDRGVGGATADAVGRRLERLAASAQVLVVTHAPQVAARAAHHWRIAKGTSAGITRTDIQSLDPRACVDELARMLAGEEITEAARAAARALIEQAD